MAKASYIMSDNAIYDIRINSRLNAEIPIEQKIGYTITSISSPYRRGTFYTTKDSVTGLVNLSLDTSTYSDTYVRMNYTAKENYTGDDSFEFLVTYQRNSDGLEFSKLKIVELSVIKSPKYENIEARYIEKYEDGISSATSITFVPFGAPPNCVPTRATISKSDSGLSIEKDIKVYDQNVTKHILNYAKTKTEISAVSTIQEVTTDVSTKIVRINDITAEISNASNYDREEYFIVTFKDFVNKRTGEKVQHEAITYVTFHLRGIYDTATSNIISVPEYLKPSTPTFEIPKINYPGEPTNRSFKYSVDFVEGDLLENTREHKDFDKYNNRTIRLGSRVPEGAINLAYYYNAVSSFEDTISIQETNTNIVNIKYAEDWIHKTNCPSKDNDQFPNSIDWQGKEGSPFEGYFGTLYRDYVVWDEVLDIDLEPEMGLWYEQFRGATKPRVPMTKFYDDGYKSGTLTLVHKISQAHDFKKDSKSEMTHKGFIPRYWLVDAKYEGIITRNLKLYNGSAKYSGIVAKKDGLSNIDPEQDRELLLYPDENGVLYDLEGNKYLDDDLFYITDKFKDDTPLYYKYKLNYRVYNTSGKDKYGNYVVDGFKLVNENSTPIPEDLYKYKVFLKETQWKDIYDAYVYTNFVPTPSMPIYMMYNGMAMDAYVGALNISPLNVKVGILERLSVLQAIDTDEYRVDTIQGITQQSVITVDKIDVIADTRDKVKIQYVISAGGVKTPPINAEIINKKYALSSELNNFKDESLIISEKSLAEYMTAKDMLLKYAGEQHREKIEKAKVFKVGFNLRDATNTARNNDKVIMYTDPDGNGLIYAKTYMDTGFKNDDGTNRSNKSLDPDCIYKEQNGKIFKGYAVRCRNINMISLSSPDETNPLKGWYPKIKYSYFNKVYEKIDSTTQLIYSVPEFHTQVFGAYGAPYKDVTEEAGKYVGNNTIKVKHAPMYIKLNSAGDPENILAYKILADGSKKQLSIDSYNFKYGYVTFQEQITDNDNVFINYTYEEQYYHYKGYYSGKDKDTKMINFNINPSQYSTYTDTENSIRENQQTYNLFNKTVYFFLRPMRRINNEDGTVLEDNEFTLYHKFNVQEAENPFDLLIGRIFVRHHASQKSTTLIDTRKRGGGVMESMADNLRRELEPDSDYYMDIGTLDGKAYQENSVIVIRLDKRILAINGGKFSEDQVKEAVYRWSAVGMYPIIEYVDIIPEDNMPQQTMVVNKHIENQRRYNPYIQAEVVEYAASNSGGSTLVKKDTYVGSAVTGKANSGYTYTYTN